MNALAHDIVQDIYLGENELHRSNMKKDKATLETFHQASPVRAERILSKGGSIKFSLSKGGSGPIFSKFYYFFTYFFQILLLSSIKIPKFKGGSILRSSLVPPSLVNHVFS